MTAAGIHADGEIRNQADGHAGVGGGLLRGVEARLGEPLTEDEKNPTSLAWLAAKSDTAVPEASWNSAGQSCQPVAPWAEEMGRAKRGRTPHAAPAPCRLRPR